LIYSRRMGRLSTSLVVPRPHADVFAFFAEAANLQRITPPWVDFRIVSPQPVEMRVGALIDYRLKVHGIPIRWRSTISAWDPPHLFIDEQLIGPYRRWVHTHRFRPVAGGTEVVDEVEFRAPFGWPAERLFVQRDVRAIFLHRQQAILDAFGAPATGPFEVRVS
jgi:ligand-binding SRPBCC domain-containing protein